MSAKEHWDSSTLEILTHMKDVSRAWDSLLEAKHMLQRIEDKMNAQDCGHTQEQNPHRRLQPCRHIFTDPDSYSEANHDQWNSGNVQTQDWETEERFTINRSPDSTFLSMTMDLPPGKSFTSSSRLSQHPDVDDTLMDRKDLIQYCGDLDHQFSVLVNPDSIRSPVNMADNRSSDDHSERVSNPFREISTPTSNASAEEMEVVLNPYLDVLVPSPVPSVGVQMEARHCFSPMSFNSLLSPKAELYTQRLEYLKNKSPSGKLERLKEKIREQKHRRSASKEQQPEPLKIPEPTVKHVMKKVRKVTFGPPPPIYKGFSSISKDPDRTYRGDVLEMPEYVKQQELHHRQHSNLQGTKGPARTDKGKISVSRKLSFNSPSPEKKAKSAATDLYGASAWREGQKLIQKLLGPSPNMSKIQCVSATEDGIIKNAEKAKNTCQKTVSKPVTTVGNKSQPYNRGRAKKSGNRSLGRNGTPDWDIQRLQRGVPKVISNMSENVASRWESISPKRVDSAIDNYSKKCSGKENIRHGEEEQPRGSRIRSYSVDEVRDFMSRKNAERKKKEREDRKLQQKAMQLKQTRLQDVFKKQKAAVPRKKACADSVVFKKNIQGQSAITDDFGLVKKDIMEWVQEQTSDLLQEESASGINSTKQKVEPFPIDYSRPLNLQDLDTTCLPAPDRLPNFTPEKKTSSDATSPDKAPNVSPYKNSQHRLQAICAVARELGKRVELEASKLGTMGLPHQLVGTDVLSAVNSPSSVRLQDLLETKNSSHNVSPTNEHSKHADGGTRHSKEKTQNSNQGHSKAKDSHAESSPLSHHARRSRKGRSLQDAFGYSSPKKGSRNLKGSNRSKTVTEAVSMSPEMFQEKGSPSRTGKTGIHRKSDPQEELLVSVSDLDQTRRDIVKKLQMQTAQQEKELAVLRQRAESEAREAERCMEELLKRNLFMCLKSGLNCLGTEHKRELKAQPSLYDKHQTVVSRHSTEQLKNNLAGSVVSPSSTKRHNDDREGPAPNKDTKQRTTAHIHDNGADHETEAREDSWDDHTQPATDSTSKWSEISEFYGSPNMLSRFTLEMAEQYLREEELRDRHQTALLRLREEALKEKTKAELAVLKHQRMCLEMKNEHCRVEEILKREHEIETNLKQEQAEIRHLCNMYRAAHQERKLLLRQQKEVVQMHQSVTHLHHTLHGPELLSQLTGEVTNRTNYATLNSSTASPEQMNQDTHSAISDLAEDDDDLTYNGQPMASDSMLVPEEEAPAEDRPIMEEDLAGPGASPGDSHVEHDTTPDHCTENKDGAVNGNPSSGLEEPMLKSVQNNLSNRNQKFLELQENLHNRSQEIILTNEDDSGLFVTAVEIQSEQRRQAAESDIKKSMKDVNPTRRLDTGNEDQDTANVISLTSEPRNHQSGSSDLSIMNPECLSGDLLPKTTDLSEASMNTGSCPSLADFLKVSAKLINISESSGSMSGRGEEALDTESGDSDVFDMESAELPSNVQIISAKDTVSPGQTSNKYSNITEILCYNDDFFDSDMSPPAVACVDKSDKVENLQQSSSTQNSKSPEINEKSKTKTAPLASESFPTSEDLSESDTKTYGVEYLSEGQDSNAIKITNTQKSTSMSPEDVSNVAGMSSSDTKDWQTVTETNKKQSVTENLISRKIEMVPFQATSSEDLFQIKSFPLQSEGEIIFITDEVLQPIENSLSEILSPVDEMLSYESGELYSTKKDFSYHSEDLPSLPEDVESIKSDDINSDDFPAPPEQIILCASKNLPCSLEDSSSDEINYLLDDNLLTEDMLLPPVELTEEFLSKGGDSSSPPVEPENEGDTYKSFKPCRPFLTLSKADDDIKDPLCTFTIGERVLVKYSKPGILKFKGLTSFEDGYWAGVALDKADGDHNGTYKGIKYFECPKKCGVFARPNEISHLLGDDKSSSDYIGDDADDPSFGDGPNPRNIKNDKQKTTDFEAKKKKDKDGQIQTLESKENQSPSCCVESSECRNVRVAYTDPPIGSGNDIILFPNSLETHHGDVFSDDTKVTHDYRLQPLRVIDTNRYSSLKLLQQQKQGLLQKVCEELTRKVLCDSFDVFAKIAQKRYKIGHDNEYVIKVSEEPGDKWSVLQSRVLSLETQNTRIITGRVEYVAEKILIGVISDSIKECKKIKWKKESEERRLQSCNVSSNVIPAEEIKSEDEIENPPICGDKVTVKINLTEGICENVIADSIQVVGNIYWKKTEHARLSKMAPSFS